LKKSFVEIKKQFQTIIPEVFQPILEQRPILKELLSLKANKLTLIVGESCKTTLAHDFTREIMNEIKIKPKIDNKKKLSFSILVFKEQKLLLKNFIITLDCLQNIIERCIILIFHLS
jgi:hypothetical protein